MNLQIPLKETTRDWLLGSFPARSPCFGLAVWGSEPLLLVEGKWETTASPPNHQSTGGNQGFKSKPPIQTNYLRDTSPFCPGILLVRKPSESQEKQRSVLEKNYG